MTHHKGCCCEEGKMEWCQDMKYDPDCPYDDKWVLKHSVFWKFCPCCGTPRPKKQEPRKPLADELEAVKFQPWINRKDYFVRLATKAREYILDGKEEGILAILRRGDEYYAEKAKAILDYLKKEAV